MREATLLVTGTVLLGLAVFEFVRRIGVLRPLFGLAALPAAARLSLPQASRQPR